MRKTIILAIMAVALLFSLQTTAQDKGKEGEKQQSANYVLVDSKTLMPVLDCNVPTGWAAGGNVAWSEELGAYPILWYFWAMAPDMSMRIAYTSSMKFVLQGSMKKRKLLEKPKDFAKKLCDNIKEDFCLDEISVKDAKVKDFEDESSQKYIEIHKGELNAHHFGERIEQVRYVEFSILFEGKLNGKDYVVHYKAPVFFAQRGLEVMATTIVEVKAMIAYGCVPEKEEQAKNICQETMEKIRLNPNAIREFSAIGSEMSSRWEKVQNDLREKILAANQQKRGGMGIGEGMWEDYILRATRVKHPETGVYYLLNENCIHAAVNENGEVAYFNDSFNKTKPFSLANWQRLK